MQSRSIPPRARRLLWFDGLAGLGVGACVLALGPVLSTLYGLPVGLVLAIGVANLTYGSCSTTLAARWRRGVTPSRMSIDVLIAANGAWAVVCLALAVVFRGQASPLGLGSLVLEAVVVGGLAIAERRVLRPQLA